jgi:hypothetical protein
LHKVKYNFIKQLYTFNWSSPFIHLRYIILNFYKSSFYALLIVFIQIIVFLVNETSLVYSNLPDRYCRIAPNELIINSFHFYWTSFWFLLPFISLSMFLFVKLQTKHFTFKTCVLTLLLFIYFSLTTCYNSMNQILLELIVRHELINPLLLNSINKYHPFVFYSSITLLMLWALETLKIKQLFNYDFKHASYNKSGYYLVLIMVTLSWGGWWAAQEGSWGGWWNWDPSEVFGLMLMIIYILRNHINHYKLKSVRLSRVLLLWWWSLIFMYYIIQLNFDLVSHNFGTKVHQFVDSYGLYISILLIVFIKITFVFRQNVTRSILRELTTAKTKKILFMWLVLSITCLILIVSFSELIINLFWNLFSVNILNSTLEVSHLLLLLVVLSLTWLFKLNAFTLIILTFTYNTPLTFKLFLIAPVFLLNFSTLHTISW